MNFVISGNYPFQSKQICYLWHHTFYRLNSLKLSDGTCASINVWIWLQISLKFVPEVRINNILAGDKPLSEPMMVNLLTHICVTRPQWVNPSSDSPVYIHFHSRKYIWKFLLWNGDSFVSASMCFKWMTHIIALQVSIILLWYVLLN